MKHNNNNGHGNGNNSTAASTMETQWNKIDMQMC